MKKVLLLCALIVLPVSLVCSSPFSYPVSTVIIDPGHGGYDPGAVGTELLEKDLTLKIARKLHSLFVDEGSITSILTRDSDEYISLSNRVKTAFQTFPGWESKAIFISIHINSSESAEAAGYEFLIKPSGAAAPFISEDAESWALSYFSHEKMSDLQRSLNGENYLLAHQLSEAFFEELNQMRDRGIKEQEVYVLNENIWPSVLVEAGFLSNDEEQQMMKDDLWIDTVAKALFDGIRAYMMR
ncbi:MAG: N-acetylmuramoyl-L-alanine amidase [Sphaerochaetaceae bacterium]|nr:N-acetylmuramoyl-L-alanine amidase [Sphaerochaetaceae bacterium]